MCFLFFLVHCLILSGSFSSIQADDVVITNNVNLVDAVLPAWNTTAELAIPPIVVTNNPCVKKESKHFAQFSKQEGCIVGCGFIDDGLSQP